MKKAPISAHIRSGGISRFGQETPVNRFAAPLPRSATWSLYKRWSGRIFETIIASFSQWARMEETRLALFVPVIIGIGIAIYFSVPTEPDRGLLGIVSIALLILRTFLGQRRPLFKLTLNTVLLITLGLVAASVRTAMVAAPILEDTQKYADITGRIKTIENRSQGWRLVIAPEQIEGLAPDATPRLVRVNWRGQEMDARSGDRIQIRAGLSRPPPPVLPGSYDFGRHLFFQGIGAVGFAVTPPKVLPENRPKGVNIPWAQWWETNAELVRQDLFNRILDKAPGAGGAIIAAIVTGKREAIDDASQAALRDAGLAHLLAISGLHMGLAAGLIFFGIRIILAGIPFVALRYPIKKWAAIAALFSGLGYLIISGSGWSARRAFIMTAIMLVAILFDRRAFSLRNVAIAATLILIMWPEALMHPGFQMSFAAVTALIAAYESILTRSDQQAHTDSNATAQATPHGTARTFSADRTSLLGRVRIYFLGIAASDTLAAIATAPFALFHFHRTAIYSLPANLVAMPVMGFWVMPFVILAVLLLPMGWDGWAWRLAASGIDVIVGVGMTVSAWPGAVSVIPAQPISWLIALTVGGLFLCLLHAPWRLAGALGVPLAMVISAGNTPPDMMISNDGDNVAATIDTHEETGHAGRSLAVFDRRRDRFATEIWMESVGLDPDRADTVAMDSVATCDRDGCVTTVSGQHVAISRRPGGLAVDCARANLVIAVYPVNRRVRDHCKAFLIDRRDAWQNGGAAIWMSGSSPVRIRHVHTGRAGRPWGATTATSP